MKIELYKDDVFIMEITSDTSNDGEYLWTIPSFLKSSTQYQIKISEASNPSIYDFSDYFEIERPPVSEVSEEIPLTLIIIISTVGSVTIIGGVSLFWIRRRKRKT